MRRCLPIVLLAVVGCRPAPGSYLKAAPVPTLEPGWRVHMKPAEGYSVALPGTFQSFDLSQFEEKGSRSGGPSGVGGLGGLGGILRAPAPDKPGTAVLSAMSTEGTTLGLAILVREEKEGNADRAKQTEEIAAALRKHSMFEIVDEKEVELPIGKATRVVAEMRTGVLRARCTTYVMVDGPVAYTALFFGMSTDGTKMPTRRIMETFRVTKRSRQN